MFRRKPPVVEYTPVVPDGWVVRVRQQRSKYSVNWDYVAVAPKSIKNLGGPGEYHGSGYASRYNAIVAAVDMAEEVNRNYKNRMARWETI